MRKLVQLAILIVYVVTAFIGATKLEPAYSPWFLVVLSSLFVFCYAAVAGGRVVISVITVFILTLAFPIGVLIAIDWPVYHSWSAMTNSFISSFKYSQFFGFEILFPVLAASISGAIASRWRSNPSFKRDWLKPAP